MISIYSHFCPPACLFFGFLQQHRQIAELLILYFSAASLSVSNISPVLMHLIFLLLFRIVFFSLQLLQPCPFNKFPGYDCQTLLHSLHCTNIGSRLHTYVPRILIVGDNFAISATKSSWVLRALLEHLGQPVLPDFAKR